MKWEDLEVGDVIKVTGNARKHFGEEREAWWALNNLTITSIEIRQSYNEIIDVRCGDGNYFQLNKDGTHRSFERLGVFFEIVSLKED